MMTKDLKCGETILIIDDDIELTALISQFLTMNGYQVIVEHNGSGAIAAVSHHQPDLIVLDLMLPGVDGLTICRQLKPNFMNPIIMLTALDDDIDEVTGLEVGADDYLCKPIKPRVLLAHIRAQLRRQSHFKSLSSQNIKQVSNGTISIDIKKRIVRHNQNEVILSSAEFDLLWILTNHAGTIISRDQLHKEIFNLEYDGFDRSIDLRVSRLRKKLDDDPKEPKIIKTIRNKGYLLAD
jgi:two-component system response regulator RstA